MSDRELDAFLGDVSSTVQHDMSDEDIMPNFEAMLARADAIAAGDDGPAAPPSPVADPEFDDFLGEVTSDLEHDDAGVAPDFLAVVTRAHALDPEVIPEAAVEEVGTYAPIISLRDAARARRGHQDTELDAFVRDVRGHVDHDLATASASSRDQPTRAGYGLAVAAGLLLALGLGAGLTTWLSGGKLFNHQDESRSEAMLSPQPAPTRDVEPEPEPAPEPEPEVVEPEPEPEVVEPSTPRRSPRAKKPSRRDRLSALEREANAAWRANRLDAAEASFRKIVALDPRGSWGESAYGELFTLQRQRGRSSVALWKAYLKRFPSGRFADDARAGLCRRAQGEQKVQCWNDYLEEMPRGSFRRQARRELEAAQQGGPGDGG